MQKHKTKQYVHFFWTDLAFAEQQADSELACFAWKRKSHETKTTYLCVLPESNHTQQT